MRLKLSLKILIALIFFVQTEAFAQTRCESLFSKEIGSKITEIQSAPQVYSRIQNVEWLKKRLLKDGELEKLKRSDLAKDHNDFFSEILYETVKLLLKDFYQPHSELQKVVGAHLFLRTIIEDIRAHRSEHKVTYEYFFKINIAIAKLISLKNDIYKDLTRWQSMLEHANESELPLYSYKVNDFFNNIMNDPTNNQTNVFNYNRSFERFKESGMYLIPMFAELSQKDFIELGVEIVPVGMTTNKNSAYDGVKSDSAYAYFFHDLAHGEIMQSQWSRMSLSNRLNYLKVQKFLASKELKISHDEKVLLIAYIFEQTHEYGMFESVSSDFHQAPQKFGDGAASRKMVVDTYKKLKNPLYNSQYRVNLSQQEYIQTLESALTKAIIQYQYLDHYNKL